MTRRLTEADRARSVFPAGGHGFVYDFEREAVLEIQTCAADAQYVFALEPEYGEMRSTVRSSKSGHTLP